VVSSQFYDFFQKGRQPDVRCRYNKDFAELEVSCGDHEFLPSSVDCVLPFKLEKIIATLNVAQEVQQSLLPQCSPREDRFHLAGSSRYCDETGGDYYDYIELPDMGSDVYAIAVGHVSGHGISSALLMASIRAYLRSRVTQAGSVADIITDVNRLVAADTLLPSSMRL
jgi:serine phosphatase RsbU (regulator of sigma subunit)